MLTVIVRSVFGEYGKFCSQYLDECLHGFQQDRIDISEWIDINKTGLSKECIICHYGYFKDISYEFEPQVCNGCHDILMMACELKKRCNAECKRHSLSMCLRNMTRNDAINMLDNSKLDDKVTLRTWILVQLKDVELIKEGAFAGTHFKEINSGVNSKWYRKSWK